MQSLSLSFDKHTKKASAGRGAFMGGVPLLLSAPSESGKPHLYRGSSMSSTVTSTTASLTTTPTGTCTPNGSDTSLCCEDMSELSLHGSDAEGDAFEGASTASSSTRGGARSADMRRSSGAAAGAGSTSTSSVLGGAARPAPSTTATAPVPNHCSSGASVSSVRSSRSSGSSASSHHRRRTTGSGCGSPPPPGSASSSSSDRAAVKQLLAVIDQVLAGRGPTSEALSAELVALRRRLTEHASGERRLSDEELTQTVGRIGAVVQSLASG